MSPDQFAILLWQERERMHRDIERRRRIEDQRAAYEPEPAPEPVGRERRGLLFRLRPRTA